MLQLVVGPRIRKSPYFDRSLAAGATHFSIYNQTYLPLGYGDPIGEYWNLVERVTLWDVAAERQVEITGPDASAFVQYLTGRNLSKFVVGQCKYAPMCDYEGRLVNDPIITKLADDRYWLSRADGDLLRWARAIAGARGFDIGCVDPDTGPLAIQGPQADDLAAAAFGEWVRDIRFFRFEEARVGAGIPVIVARSGWSKQGGFEVYLLDRTRAHELWDLIVESGAAFDMGFGGPNPIERIESNLLSCGVDNDDRANPFEVRLGGYIDLEMDADFVGRDALAEIVARRVERELMGVYLEGDEADLTAPWPAFAGSEPVGSVRAAARSPRLDRTIGLALLGVAHAGVGTELRVETEAGPRAATVTDLPFIP